MTKEELDEIRERCKKATPGPWTDDGYRVYKGTNRDSPVMFEYKHSDSIGPYDGEFIAHARKDIHRLLDHIRHLERCLSIASDECDQMKEHLESQIPRWIPVEERLPEEKAIVTACIKNRRVFPDVFYIEGCWYSAKGIVEGVTHWMPLPTKPEDEE